MTDSERLIDLIVNAKRTDPEEGSFTEYLADYLLSNGVIVPPCKVGEKVYTIIDDTVSKERYISDEDTIFEVGTKGFFTCCDGSYEFTAYSEIGKTVFLSREEAEKALKEREEK